MIGRWVTTGAVWPLAGLALALKAIDLGIQRLLWALTNVEFVYVHPFGFRTGRVLRTIMPGSRLAAMLPAADLGEGRHLARVAHRINVAVRRYIAMSTDVLTEEALFRGVPLAIALWLGGFEVVLVGAGTVLWAVLHGIGRGIGLVLTSTRVAGACSPSTRAWDT
jgi:hypothetical protein